MQYEQNSLQTDVEVCELLATSESHCIARIDQDS